MNKNLSNNYIQYRGKFQFNGTLENLQRMVIKNQVSRA